jgi:hypothetical protein
VLYTQLELTAQLHRAGEIEFRKHVGGTFGRHSSLMSSYLHLFIFRCPKFCFVFARLHI